MEQSKEKNEVVNPTTSIRMSAVTREAFKRFTETNGVKQDKALEMLLDAYHIFESTLAKSKLTEDEFKQLKSENSRLKKRNTHLEVTNADLQVLAGNLKKQVEQAMAREEKLFELYYKVVDKAEQYDTTLKKNQELEEMLMENDCELAESFNIIQGLRLDLFNQQCELERAYEEISTLSRVIAAMLQRRKKKIGGGILKRIASVFHGKRLEVYG